MKRCTRCKKELAVSEFGKNSTAKKDGLMARCNTCNREVVSKYYEKNHGTKTQRETEQNTLFQHILSLKNQGYTLKQISQEVGLDKSSISYYLNGKRKVGTLAVRKYKTRSGQ